MGKQPKKIDLDKWISKAERAELIRLNLEYEFLKIAVTPQGFFHLYFKELKSKNHETKKQAFEHLNQQYFDATGEPRYSTYNSFRHQLRKFLTNNDLKPTK